MMIITRTTTWTATLSSPSTFMIVLAKSVRTGVIGFNVYCAELSLESLNAFITDRSIVGLHDCIISQ